MILQNNASKKDNHIQITHDRIYADGSKKEIFDDIITELAFDIYIQEQLAMKIVCSPDYLMELVIGRMITGGIIRQIEEIESVFICEEGRRARVFLKEKIDLERILAPEPTCCTGNQSYFSVNRHVNMEKRRDKKTYRPEWIFALAEAFAKDSAVHKKTKGTHACYLGVEGKMIFSAEDIGRHNALDKAIGYAAIHHIPTDECMLFTTGRVPTDMVQKIITAGMPVLISKAVPTDSAIKLAKEHGLVLICRAWPDSYDLY